jgi:hypothetical protein
VYLGIAAAAHAQASEPPTWYAEFTVGPTFGHTAGAQFGGEAGLTYKGIQFFAEGGHMTDTTSSSVQQAADAITSVLAMSGTASSQVKQPLSYYAGGVRYELRTDGLFHPYGSFAVGGATVTKDVKFILNGNDVTGQLLDYGIQLGLDLAGTQTKAMIEIGIGTHMDLPWLTFLTDRWFADVSYRYAHVYLEPDGLNTNRIQFGIGASF